MNLTDNYLFYHNLSAENNMGNPKLRRWRQQTWKNHPWGQVLSGIKRRNQDNYRHAFCYTEANWHKLYPTLRWRETHRLGSKRPRRSPRRGLFLASFCNRLWCCRCEQSQQARRLSETGHRMNNEESEQHPDYPSKLLWRMRGFWHPRRGKSYLDSRWQKWGHLDAKLKQMNSQNGLPTTIKPADHCHSQIFGLQVTGAIEKIAVMNKSMGII